MGLRLCVCHRVYRRYIARHAGVWRNADHRSLPAEHLRPGPGGDRREHYRDSSHRFVVTHSGASSRLATDCTGGNRSHSHHPAGGLGPSVRRPRRRAPDHCNSGHHLWAAVIDRLAIYRHTRDRHQTPGWRREWHNGWHGQHRRADRCDVLGCFNATAAHVRAGIMAYFSISGVYRIAVYFSLGIYAMPYTAIALVLAIPYLFGIWLGAKLFSKVSEKLFLRLAIGLVLSAGLVALLK